MSNDQKCFLEVLGALLSVLTIWVATGILVYMAIQRCINQNFEVKPTEMIVVASCGVIFNIV
jgi:zinc transporter 2